MGCQNCVHYIQGEKGNEITKEPPVIVSNEIPTGELKKKDEIEKTKKVGGFNRGFRYEYSYGYGDGDDKFVQMQKEFENFDFDDFGSGINSKKIVQNTKISSGIQNEVLNYINEKRTLHGVSALKLNRTISSMAQKFAEQLAKNDELDFSGNNYKDEPLGETLYCFNGNVNAEEIVSSWYNEIRKYNFDNPDGAHDAGNFTQLVWKDSKEFGFGIARARSGMYYAVGNFFPAGNYQGEHSTNVFPPKGKNSYNKKDDRGYNKKTEKIVDIYNKFGKDSDDYEEEEYVVPKKKDKYQRQEEPEVEQEERGGDSTNDDVVNEALRMHNQLRAKHHSPPLRLNNEISKIAQKYAQYLADNDMMEHSSNQYKGEDLGENLFMCGGYKITGKNMTESWYSEIKDYNFRNPDEYGDTGHFTQVVWKESKELGIGYAKSRSGNYYGVANYYPAGNFIGNYKENVLPA